MSPFRNQSSLLLPALKDLCCLAHWKCPAGNAANKVLLIPTNQALQAKSCYPERPECQMNKFE